MHVWYKIGAIILRIALRNQLHKCPYKWYITSFLHIPPDYKYIHLTCKTVFKQSKQPSRHAFKSWSMCLYYKLTTARTKLAVADGILELQDCSGLNSSCVRRRIAQNPYSKKREIRPWSALVHGLNSRQQFVLAPLLYSGTGGTVQPVPCAARARHLTLAPTRT